MTRRPDHSPARTARAPLVRRLETPLRLVLALLVVACLIGSSEPVGASTTSDFDHSFNYDHPTVNAFAMSVDCGASGSSNPSDLNSVGGVAARLGAAVKPPWSLILPPCATNSVASVAGLEFLDDAIRSPVTRPNLGNLSMKIERQMATRGWTEDLIDEAVTNGKSFSAVNKLGGADSPATRYVSPTNGQSVVIDNATGEVIQVGGSGFRY